MHVSAFQQQQWKHNRIDLSLRTKATHQKAIDEVCGYHGGKWIPICGLICEWDSDHERDFHIHWPGSGISNFSEVPRQVSSSILQAWVCGWHWVSLILSGSRVREGEDYSELVEEDQGWLYLWLVVGFKKLKGRFRTYSALILKIGRIVFCSMALCVYGWGVCEIDICILLFKHSFPILLKISSFPKLYWLKVYQYKFNDNSKLIFSIVNTLRRVVVSWSVFTLNCE